MSIFRFGRAVIRSVFRNFEALREVPVRVGPSHGNHHTKALVPIRTLAHPQGLLSSLTRAVFQGFVAGKANLVTCQASLFKGHAIMRLMKRGEIQGPMFAFLGLVCTNIGGKSSACAQEEEQFQRLYEWIKHGLRSSQQNLSETHQPSHEGFKLDDYEIGERLGETSCNSAVYAAATRSGQEKLAIKMLFNYSTRSQSTALRREFAKEAAVLSIKDDIHDEEGSHHYINLPGHDNIVPVLHSFVDHVPFLPDAQSTYPAALPARHSREGLGRNKTLFLIMPRLDQTVRTYTSYKDQVVDPKISTLLLLQLLDSVTHLSSHGVAHRDLKTDNLLVDTSPDDCPRLALCDFGCCLAEQRLGLQLPFLTEETNRGGNTMLMAPEVATAVCGDNVVIDYSKADAWAAGAIAYELYGETNPFSYDGMNSRMYREGNLPALTRAPAVIQWVVKMLLRKNPCDRLSAHKASTIIHVFLIAPSWWWCDNLLVTQGDVLRWLLGTSVRSMAKGLEREQGNNTTSHKMKMNFLSRTSVDEVLEAVAILRGIRQLNTQPHNLQ